jgi:hypothetical protein
MTNKKINEDIRNIKWFMEHTEMPVYVIDSLNNSIKALEIASCIKEKCAYCPHCENCDVDDETLEIKALEQEPIAWILGKDNCQVAVRNMPVDIMQKICAIIEAEEFVESEDKK